MGKTNRKEQSKRHRIELSARSREAKELRELMVMTADTPEKALEASLLTINAVLILTYTKETGCTDYRTFHDWKKAGCKVKKNSTAFRIWGKPIKAKKPDQEQVDPEDQDAFRMFPMCCLFNESQVEALPSE